LKLTSIHKYKNLSMWLKAGLIITLLGVASAVGAQEFRPKIEVQPLEMPEPPARGVVPGVGGEQQPGPPNAPLLSDKTAILQALDKVTARVSKIEAEIGRPVRFGTLDIIVHACAKRPPEEPPETSVFLEVTEFREAAEPATLFVGWMFASSPALSALEHPVYDVWVSDCIVKP
jgi:hypothetical protein